MKYGKVIQGYFFERPNRFIAKIWIENEDIVPGAELVEVSQELKREGMSLVIVHVKNTGRCKELLLPDAKVILEVAKNPERKTKYDLIAVYKESLGLINMDSQAPNKVALEWLKQQDYSLIKPEFTYGASRIDFYMERSTENDEVEQYLMEVKGCTLEREGIGYFPDAPTERGVKHLKELANASEKGLHCIVLFVIQMEGIKEVRANIEMHKEFGEALEQAKRAGVKVIGLGCKVLEDELIADQIYEEE